MINRHNGELVKCTTKYEINLTSGDPITGWALDKEHISAAIESLGELVVSYEFYDIELTAEQEDRLDRVLIYSSFLPEAMDSSTREYIEFGDKAQSFNPFTPLNTIELMLRLERLEKRPKKSAK